MDFSKEIPEGKKIKNGEGEPVRIISRNLNCKDYPIVGLVLQKNGIERLCSYTNTGKCLTDLLTKEDLVLVDKEERNEDEYVLTEENAKKYGVETVSGSPARIICFDRVSIHYPIIAAITDDDGNEDAYEFTSNGRFVSFSDKSGDDIQIKRH